MMSVKRIVTAPFGKPDIATLPGAPLDRLGILRNLVSREGAGTSSGPLCNEEIGPEGSPGRFRQTLRGAGGLYRPAGGHLSRLEGRQAASGDCGNRTSVRYQMEIEKSSG